MAFGAKKIYPIDQRPGTAVGVSIPFNAPNVFFSTYTTKDAIRNNLLNFFAIDNSNFLIFDTFGGSSLLFFSPNSLLSNLSINIYLHLIKFICKGPDRLITYIRTNLSRKQGEYWAENGTCGVILVHFLQFSCLNT